MPGLTTGTQMAGPARSGHVEGESCHYRCRRRGRSQGSAAPPVRVSQGWISRLLARYRAEGEAASEPRPKRPKSSPAAIAPGSVDQIVRLRKE